jgi:hypothetical protein
MGNTQSVLGFVAGVALGALTGGVGTIIAGGYYTAGTVVTNACIYGLGGGISTLVGNNNPPAPNIASPVTPSNSYNNVSSNLTNYASSSAYYYLDTNINKDTSNARLCKSVQASDRNRRDTTEETLNFMSRYSKDNFINSMINEKNMVEQDWKLRLQENSKQERLRLEVQEQKRQEVVREQKRQEVVREQKRQEVVREQKRQEVVREQKRQENIHKSFVEENKRYEEKIEKKMEKLSEIDETFQKKYQEFTTNINTLNFENYINLDTKPEKEINEFTKKNFYKDIQNYITLDTTLEENVKELDYTCKNHLQEINYISHIPLMDIRVEKYKEEENRFMEEKREHYTKIYENIKNLDTTKPKEVNINSVLSTITTPDTYFAEIIVNGIKEISNVVANGFVNPSANSETTNQVLNMVSNVPSAIDLCVSNPKGIGMNIATNMLGEINNSYSERSTARNMINGTIGAVGLIATVAGAPITATTIGGTMLVVEGLETAYHLENEVKEKITKGLNEKDKELVLQQHERGKLGVM